MRILDCLFAGALVAAGIARATDSTDVPSGALVLWYDKPSERWTDALPILAIPLTMALAVRRQARPGKPRLNSTGAAA